MSVNEGMDKQNVEYSCRRILGSLKKKGFLTHATPQMNLNDIVLSDIKWSQKRDTAGFHFYEAPSIVKFTDTENRMVVSRGWRRRREGNCC